MERVRTVSSQEDKLDRLLVSFKDAKVLTTRSSRNFEVLTRCQIALLEWSDDIHDLVTVSIHTYERAAQLVRLQAMIT